MPGPSERRGAKRKPGSKKGMTVGSGGQRRRGLEGKGPTPKATERTGHPAARRAAAAARRGAAAKPAAKRGRAGAEYVAGRNAVVEALRAHVPATTLYVAERVEADERLREAVKLAVDSGMAILEVPRPELDRISGGAPHQGLALQVPPYEYAHPDDLLARASDADESALLVALDGVTDPRNLGAVVRSAAAFGGHGVLVPERRSAGMTAGAWKASAGTAARLPVARATNLTRALTSYRKAGVTVVGLDVHADITLEDLPAADPICLVVGAEGRGLSRLVAETCDLRVVIPMSGEAESLNAGVAAGIVLYEISRRRHHDAG